MQILYQFFNEIVPENEIAYYQSLKGIIESVDPHSSILVTKKLNGISIRITPSSSSLLNATILQVNILNNTLGLKVEYSKSIKTSISINFNIDF